MKDCKEPQCLNSGGVREWRNTHAQGILKNYRSLGQAKSASGPHVTPPSSFPLPERFSPGTLARGSRALALPVPLFSSQQREVPSQFRRRAR